MKTDRKKENNPAKHTLLAGVLSGVCCLSLLGVTTYAMFTAEVESKPSVVATADYKMEISVVGVGIDDTYSGEERSYLLPIGSYTVSLKASGSASTGFASFRVGDEVYYSQQLAPSEEMTFTVVCDGDTALTYDYQWGQHGRVENVIVADGVYSF